MLTRRPRTASHEMSALVERVAVREMEHDRCALLTAEPGECRIPVRSGGARRRSCDAIVDRLFTQPPGSSPLTVPDGFANADPGEPRIAPFGVAEPIPCLPGSDHDLLHHILGIGTAAGDDRRYGEKTRSRGTKNRFGVRSAGARGGDGGQGHQA